MSDPGARESRTPGTRRGATGEPRPTLASFGITKKQSARAQRMADTEYIFGRGRSRGAGPA